MRQIHKSKRKKIYALLYVLFKEYIDVYDNDIKEKKVIVSTNEIEARVYIIDSFCSVMEDISTFFGFRHSRNDMYKTLKEVHDKRTLEGAYWFRGIDDRIKVLEEVIKEMEIEVEKELKGITITYTGERRF